VSGSPAVLPLQAATSFGLATYSALSIDAAGTADTLTAALELNGKRGPPSVSAISSHFDVTALVRWLLAVFAPELLRAVLETLLPMQFSERSNLCRRG
jgi:hypothetical protein